MEPSDWIAVAALVVSIGTGVAAIWLSAASNRRSKRAELRATEAEHVVWKVDIEHEPASKLILTNYGTDTARKVAVTATLNEFTSSMRRSDLAGGDAIDFEFPQIDTYLAEQAAIFQRDSVAVGVDLSAEVEVHWKSQAGTPQHKTLRKSEEVWGLLGE